MNKIEKIRQKKEIVRGVIYARYSSDNQRDESITAQLRAVNDYAQRYDVVIVEEYIDKAKSATTDNRPEFLRMIADSKKDKFDIVLVHKLDRFARNRYDSIGYRMELKRQGVALISVLEYLDDESPEGIILESVLDAMSEYYSKNLAREVNKGMRETALKGQHAGGTPPLGYDVDKESKKLILNEKEAIAVKLIFRMFNEGYGYNKIVRELNIQGFRTKTGKSFSKGSLGAIIRNEKYSGVYIFNKLSSKDMDGKRNGGLYKDEKEIIRIEGAVPQIISKDEFKFAQDKINSRKKKRASNKAIEYYLLSGKIICGKCGSSYVGNRKKSGRNKSLYITYCCGARKNKQTCMNKEIRREYIETFVLEKLSEYVYNDKIIPKIVEKYNNYQLYKNSEFVEKRDNIKKIIDEKEKEIQNIIDFVMEAGGSKSLADKLKQLESEKVNLEIEYKKVYNDNMVDEVNEEDIKKCFKLAKSLISLGKLSVTKRLIDMFIDMIIVHEDRVDVIFRFHPDLLDENRSVNELTKKKGCESA
jgi:site-specific DNA recombinase